MTSHANSHKVRLTVECSEEERAYIKILAANRRQTISEFLMSPVKTMIPKRKKSRPNSETIKALKESREEELKSYKTLDEFWEAMGIDPNA